MQEALGTVGTIIAIVVVLWAVVSLALIEKLRKTFATPKEVKEMEERLCAKIEGLQNDVQAWERFAEDKLASRSELNGFGARVGNVEHMFTAVQKMAQDAERIALGNQAEMRSLRETVMASSVVMQDSNRKLEQLMLQFAEVRTELRIHTGTKPSE